MKLILTLWKTFFAWCTQSDQINKYRDTLEKNIFSCMEMSKQSYPEVSKMPVKRFYNYLKWKTDLEEEKQKMILDEVGK